MIGDVFLKTVSHFFPKLTKWLSQVDDPRNPKKITYSPSHLQWLGILLFLLRLGSRRKIGYKFSTEEFLDNLAILTSGYNRKVPHPDTLEYFLEKLDPEELYKVR